MPDSAFPRLGGQRLRCLLFDLDGTLVDTAPDLAGAINALRAERGQPPVPEARLRPVCSQGARGLIERAFGVTPEMADFDALRARFLSLYGARLDEASRPFDGIAELLAALSGRGIAWGIVTNKPRAYAEPLVTALGWQQDCAVLVAGDDAERAKPAPDTLRLACRRLGLAAEDCAYVGDDPRDITAAAAVPMRNIAARWGYVEEAPPIEGWGAEHICDQPPAILDLLA